MVEIILGLAFLSGVLLGWGLIPDVSQRAVRRRLFAEVATERRPNPLDVVVKWLTPIHRPLPLSRYNGRIWRFLDEAGLRVSTLHFLVIQEIGALTGLLIYAVLFGFKSLDLFWLALLVGMGFMVPYLWVKNRIKMRRMSIARDLPEVADLLNLCVGAGGDFMSGMTRIVREFRPCPVREELGIVLQEIRVGKRRRDALRAFATRVKSPEASTFSRTLIQVDRMGTGLAEALKVLSEDMRQARYHWAERFAQQAPLKMLLPLLFGLASALIIVAGPILLQFTKSGFGVPEASVSDYKAEAVPELPTPAQRAPTPRARQR